MKFDITVAKTRDAARKTVHCVVSAPLGKPLEHISIIVLVPDQDDEAAIEAQAIATAKVWARQFSGAK